MPNTDLRRTGEECGTFSKDVWLALSPALRSELENIRIAALHRMASQIRENEHKAGIQPRMRQLHSAADANVLSIRDTYFSIPDSQLRIKTINDFHSYHLLRRNYDESIVLEASYQHASFRLQLLKGWIAYPEVRTAVLGSLFVIVVYFLLKSTGLRAISVEGLFIALLAYVCASGAFGQLRLERLESLHLLLWEIEKSKRGIGTNSAAFLSDWCPVFSDDERVTGEQSNTRSRF